MGRPRSCPRDTRTGDSENPVHCAPSSGMVTRSKSCGSSTVRVVGPKAFEPWSESRLRNDLWCAFSATGAGVTPSRHRPRLTRCAALQCAGNNPRIHCLRPLNSCLPSAGCRTGAPTGQLETGRPNRWHDRFTLNIGLDRNDTIMSATCKKETFPCRVPQKAFPEPPWSDRVATI